MTASFENRVAQVLANPDVMDALAAIEHERWSHWQRYMHDSCEERPDGSLLIPSELAARWGAQMTTKFEELTETEKESDRDQVRRYLPTLLDVIEKGLAKSDIETRPGGHRTKPSDP